MSTPKTLQHIIIIGETNTSRHNMANYVRRIQKIGYTIQLITGAWPTTLNDNANYMFITSSLSLIPAHIQTISVILSKPLVCI